MDVTSEQLVFMYGELAIENRVLRNQIEAMQAQIVAISKPEEKPNVLSRSDVKKDNTDGGGNGT